MKTKFYVLAALLLASMVNVVAEDITIFSGSRALSYDNEGNESTLFISYTQFSSAQAGNEIKITGDLTGAGDHKLYIGEYNTAYHHPGSDYRNINSLPFSFYLTEDMIAKIGNVTEHQDFRLYGEGITVTKVELCPGKAGALKFGKTIWTGYFWMDDKWSLELFKEAFTNAGDLSKYRTMRIYYEANSTDFLMRLFTKFGDNPDEYADGDDLKIAGSYTDANPNGEARTINEVKVPMELITLHDNYVDIPLTEAIKTNLGTINETYGRSLFIKCNLNGVPAFNVTDVVLLPISPDDCSNCFYVY